MKLRLNCHIRRCWSNITPGLLLHLTLPVSCLKCFQKHALVLRLALTRDCLKCGRHVGNGKANAQRPPTHSASIRWTQCPWFREAALLMLTYFKSKHTWKQVTKKHREDMYLHNKTGKTWININVCTHSTWSLVVELTHDKRPCSPKN